MDVLLWYYGHQCVSATQVAIFFENNDKMFIKMCLNHSTVLKAI